ncbi:MAG: hypothetical protein OIN86_04190 [Candidatus Methanoperedens sp.]|nr:hypothetical protein [Candidatus Methanoperedens sp.]CAG0988124.1 hypothetical protein METP1_02147 [Methanosarcinales archaeon]
MNRKTIAICFLLILEILIGIPESFAYPQNDGSCSSCHIMTPVHTGDAPGQIMNPMRYNLGVIGTGLVVMSQFYSLHKRVLRKRGRQP